MDNERFAGIARRICSYLVVPKRAPDKVAIEEIRDRVLRLIQRMPETGGNYSFTYDTTMGDITPNADALKRETESILEVVRQNRIPIDFWGYGYIVPNDARWNDGYDSSHGWSILKGRKGWFGDPDWADKIIAEYGGQPVEIPESIMRQIEMFTDKTGGRSYVFPTPKSAAFFSFKAVELLDAAKRLPGVKVEETLRKSPKNPQFYSYVGGTILFGEGASFSVVIQWSRSRAGETFKVMRAELKVAPKYEIER